MGLERMEVVLHLVAAGRGLIVRNLVRFAADFGVKVDVQLE